MADLTVDSLSITPGSEWPIDSSAFILAARDRDDELKGLEDGVALDDSDTAGTWAGNPSIQTDFSP